ncbi:uncharacterized protein LOC144129563 [Amblyomma americanum]
MEKERKKKRTMPKNDLLEMIEKKKRKINQAARSEETEKMQGKLERAEKELKKKEEMIASLKRTIEKQEERILKLSTLNEGLQETIIKMKDVEAPVYPKEFVTPPRPQQHSTASNSGAVQACLKSPASPPPSTLDHSVAQEDPLSDKIDLGNGLLIKRTTWKTIEGRTKDSLFVKDLLVAVWDPAVLLTKSLEGKHCPRHPGRQRKEPLTPWKVAVLKDRYRERLRAQGFPEGHLENALRSFNRFISEKISDIEKTAKRHAEGEADKMERKRSKLVARAVRDAVAKKKPCCDHLLEVEALKQENAEIKKQLQEQKDLIDTAKMLKRLQRAVNQLTSAAEGAKPSEPERNTHRDIGGGVMVSEATLTRLEESYRDAPCKIARALIRVVFSDEELLNKTLFGRQANSHKENPVKPALDQKRVSAVLEYTCCKFRCSDVKLKRSLGSMLQKMGTKNDTSSKESSGE